MPGRSPSSRSVFLVPFAAVLALYLPALTGALVYDDLIFLRDSPLYRDPALWQRALFGPFLMGVNYFRPLVVASYMLDLRLFGLAPPPMHAVNVLVHALNAGLVALLARRLFATAAPWTPVAVAIAYGAHPALVESAAWISGRFDVFVTAFVLGALLVQRERTLAVAGLLLGAMFCKESAVVVTLLFPFLPLIEGKRTLAWKAPAVALTLYLVARVAALGALYRPETGDTIGLVDNALLVLRTVAHYARLAVFPFFGLSPVHPPPAGSDVAGNLLALVIVIALAAGAIVLVRRARPVAGLVAAGAAALLPVLNILPLHLGSGSSYVAERFLALPLAFFALATVPLVSRAFAHPAARVALAGVVLAFAATTLATIPRWHDGLALWTWTAEREPASLIPQINLSLAYGELGQWDRVLEHTERALVLDPGNALAWNNRGTALEKLGRLPEARDAFAKAAAGAPRSAAFAFNHARLLGRLGQSKEAEARLEQVLAIDELYVPALTALASIDMESGRADRAVALLLRARERPEVARQLAIALLELGEQRRARGEYEPALLAFRDAATNGAHPDDVAYGETSVLLDRHDLAAAESRLREALARSPDNPRLIFNRGRLAAAYGDVRTARAAFTRASQLEPSWDEPRKALAAM